MAVVQVAASVKPYRSAKTFFIKPTLSFECDGQHCYTMSEFAQYINGIYQLSSNTTIYFLPGTHTVNETMVILVEHIDTITLIDTPAAPDSTSAVTVHCVEKAGFSFVNVSNIYIRGIDFVACGLKLAALLPDDVYKKFFYPLTIQTALLFLNVHFLTVKNVQVRESNGYGLFGTNILGNSSITDSRFHSNNRIRYHAFMNNTNKCDNLGSCRGGNVLLRFVDNDYSASFQLNHSYIPYHTLTISRSVFSFGFDAVNSSATLEIQLGGGGIGIINKMLTQILNITIESSKVIRNYSPDGSNLYILDYGTPFTRIRINNSVFGNGGLNEGPPRIPTRGGGIRMVLTQDLCMFFQKASIEQNYIGYFRFLGDVGTTLWITNSQILNNTADTGGGLHITQVVMDTVPSLIKVVMENCTITGNNSTYYGSVAVVGTRKMANEKNMHICLTLYNYTHLLKSMNALARHNYMANFFINISRSDIERNFAGTFGGLFLGMTEDRNITAWLSTTLQQDVAIKNCSFYKNTAVLGGSAMMVFDESVAGKQNTGFSVYNSTFEENQCFETGFNHIGPSTVLIFGTWSTRFGNTSFTKNIGTAIHATASNIIFRDNVTFTGNKHGAIALNNVGNQELQCSIALEPHSKVFIYNNTSPTFGAGIHVTSECRTGRYNQPCFFRLISWDGEANVSSLDISVTIEDNIAGMAGNSIYTELPFEDCSLVSRLGTKQMSWSLFTSIFNIEVNKSTSEIASQPYKLCFCSNFSIPSCGAQLSRKITAFPGQNFNVSVVAVGQFNGTAPAVAKSTVSGSLGKLGESQYLQQLQLVCTNLTFAISTREALVEITVSIDTRRRTEDALHMVARYANSLNPINQSIEYPQAPSLMVPVHLKECPLGFILSADTHPTCQCISYLQENDITCSISDLIIHRTTNKWIGTLSGGDGAVIVHNNCPFDYCIALDIDISLYEQDMQCALDHSGILCGACKPGFSLALGTSNCLRCPDRSLPLLLAFAAAGLLLVILLLKCNLTVSVGTVNGLTLYANIVRVNNAVLFPAAVVNSNPFSSFLSVFIAWLNLDFGIESCFYNGMDAYGKTWLQFTFPVYIWAIAGLLIILTWYSSTALKLAGSNAVPVLATLFLLSYAKLLRTVIAVIAFTTLSDEHGSVYVAWLLDGNIQLFDRQHVPLFLVALAFTLLYIIPFTLLVLLAPCLQAASGYRALRWVNRVKPLLDAYQGPYRDQFRYWTGLTLVIRIVLFVVFAINVSSGPAVNLLATGLTIVALLTLCWNIGLIYRNIRINWLESFIILNLAALVLATYFVHSSLIVLDRITWQRRVSCFMVGSAFLAFCFILAVHLYQWLHKINTVRDFATRSYVKVRAQIAIIRNIIHPPVEAIADPHNGSENSVNVPLDCAPTVTFLNLQLREPLLSDNRM